MAKLTDFQTPTGARGNVLNPKSWVSLIIGSLVLIAAGVVAWNIWGALKKAVPSKAASWMGGGSPFTRPTENATPTQTTPGYNVFN